MLPKNPYKKPIARYSKHGCINCKTSHIKCDEEKPQCSNCAKKSKACTYENNFIIGPIQPKSKKRQCLKKNLSNIDIDKNVKDSSSKKFRKQHYKNTIELEDKNSAKITDINNQKLSVQTVTSNNINQSELNINFSKETNPNSKLIQPSSEKIALKHHPFTFTSNFSNIIPTNNSMAVSVIPPVSFTNHTLSKANNHEISDATSNNNNVSTISTSNANNVPQVQSISKDNVSNFEDNEAVLTFIKNNTFYILGDGTDCRNFFPIDDIKAIFNPNNHISSSDYQFFEPFTVGSQDWLNNFDRYSNSVYYFCLEDEEVRSLIDKDPIKIICETSMTDRDGLSSFSLRDDDLKYFCWKFFKATKSASFQSLFSPRTLDDYMYILRRFGNHFDILNNIIQCLVASMMSRIYSIHNENKLYKIWNDHVRLPTMKLCLDGVVGLSKSNTTFLTLMVLEVVVIQTLGLVIGRPHNKWRQHLDQCFTIFEKSEKLLNKNRDITESELDSFSVFKIFRTFIAHIEICAYLTCDNGGSLQVYERLKSILSHTTYYDKFLIGNKFNIQTGYVVNTHPLLMKVVLNLVELKLTKNICLFGNNIIKLKSYKNKDRELADSMNTFGLQILEEISKLEIIRGNIENELFSDDCSKELVFTSKRCQWLVNLSLKLYIQTFYLKKTNNELIKEDTAKFFLLWSSLPSLDKPGILCQWTIYLVAVVCIAMSDEFYYNHLCTMVKRRADCGIPGAAVLYKKLLIMKPNFEATDYEMLVMPDYDCFVI
ncbi:hypothetical protein TBLA_0H03910 [Henningerozyma blattae CBS 6284]|uniref:Zn(2)-C6 fungal-type domain-containing protein n=1 Tax=Henningerozyma blattae (strain ATCC 34711 / CBS 6284 / DSM 70876 / NBRC 10599 / NRRL Y-10934 / UCD 77-7) TaxID=1071380 RepID=I2H8H0_HENB6|nr:hypothetical protein TBLA_0H03910 [Tetrapisispora blattae CBS 6284]CCH62672.1 hypothetical protein TBLA_0H03910 [Tetrapisispora blattae CBS 6284]